MFRLASNACIVESEAVFRLTINRSLSSDSYNSTWSALSNENNRSIATHLVLNLLNLWEFSKRIKRHIFYTANYLRSSEYLFLFVANFIVISKLPLFGKHNVCSANNNPD